jgi:hypothetical protein
VIDRPGHGNPEPSPRCSAGRCRDYLGASSALDDRLERPAPHQVANYLRVKR